jgi:hypothetical protein
LIGLTTVGFASAAFSLALGVFKLGVLAPGAIFGIAIILYLSLWQGNGALSRSLLFLCACSVAYPLAEMAVIGTGGGFQPEGTSFFESTNQDFTRLSPALKLGAGHHRPIAIVYTPVQFEFQ